MVFTQAQVKKGDDVSSICLTLRPNGLIRKIENYSVSHVDEKHLRIQKKNPDGTLDSKEHIVDKSGFDKTNLNHQILMAYGLVFTPLTSEAEKALKVVISDSLSENEKHIEESKKRLEESEKQIKMLREVFQKSN